MNEAWQFLTAHWRIIISLGTPFGAFLGVAIPGFLTYRGWLVNYRNNTLLEKQKYDNSVNLEKQKAELKFVSDQIQYLYGPLMALSKTYAAAFSALMISHGGGRRNFFDGTKLTSEELRQWRLWRTGVLMPIVYKMEETIMQNGHLIKGSAMPDSFFNLLAHVSGFKAVIKEWAKVIEDDKAEKTDKINEQHETPNGICPVVPHLSINNFPQLFHRDVEEAYMSLKSEQEKLIQIVAPLVEIRQEG